MYIPEFSLLIASTNAVQAIREMLPLLILGFYCLALEIVLNKCDLTFSQSWWFFFTTIVLTVSDLAWVSWTASTPMADIIVYAENASQLIFSVFAFLFVVCLLLIWMVASGVRQISIEAAGSGWGWALLRLTPLIAVVWIAINMIIKDNALVGTSGFLNLIKM